MPNQNKKIFFPEEVTDIIFDLIKKYKLEETQVKIEKEIGQAKTIEERIRIASTLPSIQISKTAREAAEGKISPDEISSLLQKRLGISQKEAEKLSNDLKKKILILAQEIPLEEKVEILPLKRAIPKEEKVIPLEKPLPGPPPPLEKPPLPPKPKDIYREPIE